MGMTISLGLRAIRLPVLALLLVALSGCFSVKLVSDYDPQIDQSLTALHNDTLAFVDRMIALNGTPGGSYAENEDFHRDAAARMETLLVRARANQQTTSCPSAPVLDRVLSAARLGEEWDGRVRTMMASLEDGGCELVLLTLLRDQFASFRDFHRAQGALGIRPSQRPPLLDGGLGSLLRAAMAVQIAKRAGE